MSFPSTNGFDLIVFGATGKMGQLAVRHIAKSHNCKLKWALAGRSEARLTALKRELSLDVPILLADTSDRSSLEALASNARVVITTVGPYMERNGIRLAELCMRSGTHLVDITADSLYVKQMIDTCHATTARSGAKLIPSCGFDSVPADLGVLLLADHLRREHGTALKTVVHWPVSMSTRNFGSAIIATSTISRRVWEGGSAMMRRIWDPYLLLPPGVPRPPHPRTSGAFGYDPVLGGWTAPGRFSVHDAKIVHRSNALLKYGSLVYTGVILVPGRLRGFLPALLMTLLTEVVMLILYLPPTRALLLALLPAQRAGAAPAEPGHFKVALLGEGDNGQRAKVTISTTCGDAQQETAVMLAECGLALALDSDKLPSCGGGVLTPASGLGMVAVERLRAAGIALSVEDFDGSAPRAAAKVD
ncbi:Saccharopine dehydrogenase-domain-containing protein [Tribonema minus]|uniref:Saccharopine dehydrogenase-domain-containing protein n=1 Tax=Tribonema minus TaxID=303371 RepID=A0A835ZEX6_9STRA|nr:Saccharopine dehydrogenase-domain-containing protein [Tribonema minus]